MPGDRQKSKQIAVWVSPLTHAQVMEKARQEHINLSALLRDFLGYWLAGMWPPPRLRAEGEPPAPQEGQ